MAQASQAGGQFDVAIVGAGPVGAALAALLGQAGLRTFIGETNESIYPLPRAAHFDHEIMRIFQQIGITDAIAPSIVASDRYVFRNKAGDILLDFDLRGSADTGWRGYMMHQPGIERAIRDRIAGDSKVELRTGVSFKALDDDGTSVRSTWIGPDGEFEIQSTFLVGCDGAWSPVRESLGIGFEDLGFDEPWLVLDLLVDDDNDLPDLNIQLCDPERPTTYVIMGKNRRRFEFMMLPGETTEVMLDDEKIAKLLSAWSSRGIVEVERKAVYRFHALVAKQWHQGRVFLAGDAAHQMPPFAGQGMCSGIRDAHALSWRLPLALKSANTEHLFDSYQAEREPHVRAITQAAIETGRVVCIHDPAAAAERDRHMIEARRTGAPLPDISSPPLALAFGLPDTASAGSRFFQPVVTEGGKDTRLDDILGPGGWLISRGQMDLPVTPGLTQFKLDDARLAAFREALASRLDEANAAALLVRGDRYVFASGNPAELAAAFSKQVGV
ncbi:bifunctional 3-(3-hydroxy-phenyl)propionate/3-hydroxycinnamic acid hydroxylase [Novosphingobium sp.]|uniref:bifunctional 3-(3-hydroxy-phenyl)propionate/3-hydroxycinnamic acid hydroxylase n=1 Tax=Novosphingobium sp. TaxID=1874826 RepID=UPI00286DCD2D|nr:bifunctional 3-(3-hydroxy-phenyl)propionate/3-hydroxycinnamic acid hydroxylase [Novosphingobium sp.]